VSLAERVMGAVSQHPAVQSIELVGSRAEGRATELSDWDFRVTTDQFEDLAGDLPRLVAELEPLAQQWDRLSSYWCYMLMLRGPVKVDLIFPELPHADEPPWRPSRDNLAELDAHFWDWTLWLRSKEVAGKTDLVESELEKLFAHLLAPLGVTAPPMGIGEAVEAYRAARERAEAKLGVEVPRGLEDEVAPALSLR
jgi:predicted nucleotidyltransferase